MPDPAATDPIDPDERRGDVRVGPTLTLPAAAVRVRFVRSRGPGGQNVNKVSTAAELRVALADLTALGPFAADPSALARLRTLAGSRLTQDGEILIVSDAARTQEGNRREATDRLADLIRRALVRPKTRRKTKPSRGAKLRRLSAKKQRGQTKAGRRAVGSGGAGGDG